METTENQEQIIKLSESKNPYSQECPNRQLWSEGFRAGLNHKKKEFHEIRNLIKDEYAKNRYDTNDSFFDRFAKTIYDAL